MLQLKFFIVAVVLLPAFHLKVLNVRKNFDPGTCVNSTHGELVLVKDRESKDTILVCTEDEGVYTWKTTEGSKPPGEYFNPAYDCLEILNQNTKAKDGYYWINFHRSVPHKVWCDMTTDGGGYMLIGRMNDSVTWDVPSSNNTVELLGSPQWSSAFGDVPILDFRIQISTDELNKHVKAHWSFRFKNKRPLKKLLMVNEGGCPYHLPGIGDISFVKNLVTEEIVTKNFQCSVFGVYSHPSAKIGWSMMNSCLEKPCSYGFAFHRLFPMQFDFSGGFSFLAGNNSGLTDGSTAFFGCDKAKCCACYGPPGDNGVYCGNECQPKNGGIITKNANALFWVRLNPPQKVWEKCMEYRTEEENGDAAWYKLVGDRNVPVKGRCGKNEAILNDGIVVVPDDVTADKVPEITGLLAYQKDSEVLRLRKNDTWIVMADQEMVDSLKSQVAKLQHRISELETQDTSTNSRVSKMQNSIRYIQGFLKHYAMVRLNGAGSSSRGRVEVYYPYHGWGTVCDDHWDIKDGHVVCRQLGFSKATAVYNSAHYGQGSGKTLLDDLLCTGNEIALWYCPHVGWRKENCGHHEDASVDCE